MRRRSRLEDIPPWGESSEPDARGLRLSPQEVSIRGGLVEQSRDKTVEGILRRRNARTVIPGKAEPQVIPGASRNGQGSAP